MRFYSKLVCWICFLVVSALLAASVDAQDNLEEPEKVFGMKSSVLKYVSVDVETSLNIMFVNVSEPSVVTPDNIGSGVTPTKQAAIVNIKGAPFEAMIDIESAEVMVEGASLGDVINVSSFTLADDSSLNSVMVMPFENDTSYSVGVGGSIGADHNIKEFYTGINRLNVNYL